MSVLIFSEVVGTRSKVIVPPKEFPEQGLPEHRVLDELQKRLDKNVGKRFGGVSLERSRGSSQSRKIK